MKCLDIARCVWWEGNPSRRTYQSQAIVNNNQNTTYNSGGDVFNYNPVDNSINYTPVVNSVKNYFKLTKAEVGHTDCTSSALRSFLY